MDYTWGNLDETVQRGRETNGGYQQERPFHQETYGSYSQQHQQQPTHRIIRQRSASELTDYRDTSIVSPVSPVSPVSSAYSTYQPSIQGPTPQEPRSASPSQSRPTQNWINQQSRGIGWSLQTQNQGRAGTSSVWSPQQPRASSWSPERFFPLNAYDGLGAYDGQNKPLPPIPSVGYSGLPPDDSPWEWDYPSWATPPVPQLSRQGTLFQPYFTSPIPPIQEAKSSQQLQQKSKTKNKSKSQAQASQPRSKPQAQVQSQSTSRSRSQPLRSQTQTQQQQRPHYLSRPLIPQTWSDPAILVLPSETRLEDPQRIQSLSQLQEAMMTIGSLDDGGDARGLFVGEKSKPKPPPPHRGPLAVGWAVSRSDFYREVGVEGPVPSGSLGGGPWEREGWRFGGGRRCSSAGG